MDKSFRIYMTGMFVIIALTFTLQMSGHHTLAMILAYPGVAAWMVGTILYIVFRQSQSRWPGTTAWQRFVNVITFTRYDER